MTAGRTGRNPHRDLHQSDQAARCPRAQPSRSPRRLYPLDRACCRQYGFCCSPAFRGGHETLLKRVLRSVARSVDPPNLATRRGRSQRVQHREYRRCADAGAEQNHRRIAGPQRETSPRRAHLKDIAGAYVVVKIRADNPVRFSFDAYPISPPRGVPDIE